MGTSFSKSPMYNISKASRCMKWNKKQYIHVRVHVHVHAHKNVFAVAQKVGPVLISPWHHRWYKTDVRSSGLTFTLFAMCLLTIRCHYRLDYRLDYNCGLSRTNQASQGIKRLLSSNVVSQGSCILQCPEYGHKKMEMRICYRVRTGPAAIWAISVNF